MTRIIIIITISLLVVSTLFLYQSIFRISPEEPSSFQSSTFCHQNKIANCELHSGDILIKRHLTERTIFLVKMTRIYYTHAALYLENEFLLEAVGYERNKQNEVVINKFRDTDWNTHNIESWILLRPTKQINKEIMQNLAIDLAHSDKTKFGLTLNPNSKTSVYCSQLIWSIYAKQNYPLQKNPPNIITPDFLVAQAEQNNFTREYSSKN